MTEWKNYGYYISMYEKLIPNYSVAFLHAHQQSVHVW